MFSKKKSSFTCYLEKHSTFLLTLFERGIAVKHLRHYPMGNIIVIIIFNISHGTYYTII